METKICKRCGRELPLSEFYKAKSCKDGHLNVCKECYLQQQKHYRQEHKETIAEQKKHYRQEHKETIAEWQKQWYQDNREDVLKQQKQYYQEHKKEKTEYQKQHYQDNKDTILELQKQYRQNNKDAIAERQKQYYQTPNGRASSLVSGYRRADKNANRGECTLTAQWIIDNIFSGQKCIFCGESDWEKLGCDRIDNSLPHTPNNVNPCCDECNKKRGKKEFEEFLLMI